jgi:MFS family permease
VTAARRPAARGAAPASTLRELVSDRPWRRWIVASFLARLPLSMVPLGLVVVGDAVDGSLTLGARLTGVATLCCGLIAPARGRRLDGRELRGALRADCVALAAVFAAFGAAVALRWPVWTLYALCVPQGWAMAGVWAGLRALLAGAVPARHLRRSHIVESLLTEVTFGVGPVLVGLLAAAGGARLCMAATAAAALLAAAGLGAVGTLRPPPLPRTHPLRRPGIAGFALLTFFVTMGFALVEANVPQRMEQYGLPAAAGGWFLAIFALGSCLGGLAVSAVAVPRRGVRRAAALLLLAFAVLVVPSALAPGTVAYGLSLVLAPLAFVPLNGIAAAEFEARLAGTGQRAEGFSYFTAAMIVGGSLGFLANGLLIGPLDAATVPLLATGLFAVLAAVMAAGHRRATRRERP